MTDETDNTDTHTHEAVQAPAVNSSETQFMQAMLEQFEAVAEQWVQQHLYNTVVSRLPSAVETVRDKLPALKGMLLKSVELNTNTNNTAEKEI